MDKPLARTQLYYPKKMMEDFPQIRQVMNEYDKLGRKFAGRRLRNFDVGMACQFCDFQDKVVAELGARGSVFGSFITDKARLVFMSDYFRRWENLGGPDRWFWIWRAAAKDKSKLISGIQDMHALGYPNEFFDVVVSFSVIEHCDDDTKCMQEIARVLKKGGTAIISTEFSETYNPSRPRSRKYDLDALFRRLVKPSGLKLDSETMLDWKASEEKGKDFQSGILFFTK